MDKRLFGFFIAIIIAANIVGVFVMLLLGIIVEYWTSSKYAKKHVFNRLYYKRACKNFIFFSCLPGVGFYQVCCCLHRMVWGRIKDRKEAKKGKYHAEHGN